MPWNCPACDGSRLAIRDESFQEGETGASLDGHDSAAWEPEWIDGRFSCILVCGHCKATVAVAGKYRVQDERRVDEVSGETGDYVKYYRPLFFSDAPHVIRLPSQTPEPVSEELLKSFQLFWADLESCANRIRTAVERLLTHQRIRRTNGRPVARAGRKRTFLTLHDRIALFESKESDIARKLMAVKWIGNAGSHAAPIVADDVFDAYELMAWVLDELYVKRESRISALSRSINRRKAPRSRRRGS